MADIHLHAGSASSVTCVSNYFIDHFLKSLSGDAVKVYLTLLRCIGDRDISFSCSELAGRLGITARQVRTSFDALSSAGLVALDYDSEGELCDICVKSCSDYTAETAAEPEVEEAEEIIETVSDHAEEEPQQQAIEAEEPEETAPEMRAHGDSDRNNPEVKELLFIVQRYLGHTLSNNDLQSVLYWYYDLHMSVDTIDYLITSNLEKGKSSVTYMNQVAIAWYKKGIHTKDAASNEQKQFSSETNTVRRAFGISGHAMTPGEMQYIDRWFHEWNFSQDMVEEACSRTIINIGQPKYSYADKILDDWHKKGITTLDQVHEDDDSHKQENEKKYKRDSQSAGKSSGSFSFTESNGYDDAAIAAAMLKRNTF